MDPDRIDRALREGPPDEPTYVAGSFRDSSPRRGWLVVAGAAVALALVVGFVVGGGLLALRGNDVGGSPQPRILTEEDLLGTWRSDPITRQAWIDGLAEAGFDSGSIDEFLTHDPIQDEIRYTLDFFTGATFTDRLMVKAEVDGGPIADLGGGSFAVQGDGSMLFTEIVPGTPEPRCQVLTAVAIDGQRMTIQILGMENCEIDAQMAYTAFFELSPFTRQEP
jgi:hypothetical protein